ncbi:MULTISPECIES: cellulase family glycosylhydrolase [unclassified Chelatococcus]|uniref:glycoside hydrolase family 5 protein n=1 Tax=unclassified Chelatococcus TaxID=2638111 RepID=UPI001BCC4D8A|nr:MULTISPECIES: cellulase family glycosylhydrolase [unclassified Chelatococcus]MBS7697316.1 cellulase family glycosylhydrolase [Chelatococcus sp. YT9]MBX3556387.1 cellulase family glycosylhydrolase [Chelatococcus sp.]
MSLLAAWAAWLRRIACMSSLMLVLSPASASTPAPPDQTTPAFRRGTNVTWFAFPATIARAGHLAYTASPYATPDRAEPPRLRALGFDHVRMPIDFGPLLEADQPGREGLLSDIIGTVRSHQAAGLGVIATLMAPGLNGALPEAFLDGVNGRQFRRYQALAGQVASRLDKLPPHPPVALELLNEPQQACRAESGTDWTAHQQVLVHGLRKGNIRLPLLLTGGCWSTIKGLVMLDGSLFKDRRNLVSAHFYDPFVFTHQGSTWTLPFLAEIRGVPYPAANGRLDETLARTNAAFAVSSRWPSAERDKERQAAEEAIRWYFTSAPGRAAIDEAFTPLKEWQQRNDIDPAQIVVTEFGAMRPAGALVSDDASRARWLSDVSAAIARNGWGWTLWLLSSPPFGLEGPQGTLCPAAELAQAIGLTIPASCRPVPKR